MEYTNTKKAQIHKNTNTQIHKYMNTQIEKARKAEGSTETDGKPSSHIVLRSFIPQTGAQCVGNEESYTVAKAIVPGVIGVNYPRDTHTDRYDTRRVCFKKDLSQ